MCLCLLDQPKMFDFRRLRNDVLALVLFGVVAYVGLSLVSWDSADPPATQTYPVREVARNLGGNMGAYLAQGLRAVCGLGAYFVWLSLLAVDIRLFSRRGGRGWGGVALWGAPVFLAGGAGVQLVLSRTRGRGSGRPRRGG